MSGLVQRYCMDLIYVRWKLLYWTVLRALGIFFVCLSGGICVCVRLCVRVKIILGQIFHLSIWINKRPKLSCLIKPLPLVFSKGSHTHTHCISCACAGTVCVCCNIDYKLTLLVSHPVSSPYWPYCCLQSGGENTCFLYLFCSYTAYPAVPLQRTEKNVLADNLLLRPKWKHLRDYLVVNDFYEKNSRCSGLFLVLWKD